MCSEWLLSLLSTMHNVKFKFKYIVRNERNVESIVSFHCPSPTLLSRLFRVVCLILFSFSLSACISTDLLILSMKFDPAFHFHIDNRYDPWKYRSIRDDNTFLQMTSYPLDICVYVYARACACACVRARVCVTHYILEKHTHMCTEFASMIRQSSI